MTTYTINEGDLNILKGKTILLIGGSTGIGRAAVQIALDYGANVALGDWNEDEGRKVLEPFGERALFRKCDVSNWDDVLSLFEAAHAQFGVINSVLSNAGINTHEGLLRDEFDTETGKLQPPDLKSIQVNFIGHLYVTKCAMHYFGKHPEVPCQLVLTSSAGAFFPAPPIYLYCAAKSGILGLMRSLRSEVIKKNVTVNIVAPWLTVTPMLLDDWLAGWTLPKNTAEGVAQTLFLPIVRNQINGKSFFVAGDEAYEFEDTLFETEPSWMGERLCRDVRKGQEILLGLGE
ncbi:hypothetical protein JX265_001050 [Neoarthrinium moseri]|uniref:NAD(P)-binding protein n=1 Tax=Neoarthrinium moseri TaxID=1658444 RepID=A0A9Q0AUT5_9PEZI|nr:uncharacterized protein JN550_004678 [Neoarthrinium moseri]KAI1843756.1 hypothetical protein JX266_010015 [Neoarthrinium moseri]KAI1871233.1 hypothetical protein JN550_004678 [Neoarthrinium moseri]KAI1880810.1 hypothetical protein JX265_001050 [Neoarthrinium moseri]